jgi:hypothetical protein
MATTLNGRRARSCVSQGYFSGFRLARRSQSLARLIRTMLHKQPPLDRANHRLQRLELSCQHDQARTGINTKTGILFVRDDLQQLLVPLASLRCHNTELSQMRPQGI